MASVAPRVEVSARASAARASCSSRAASRSSAARCVRAAAPRRPRPAPRRPGRPPRRLVARAASASAAASARAWSRSAASSRRSSSSSSRSASRSCASSARSASAAAAASARSASCGPPLRLERGVARRPPAAGPRGPAARRRARSPAAVFALPARRPRAPPVVRSVWFWLTLLRLPIDICGHARKGGAGERLEHAGPHGLAPDERAAARRVRADHHRAGRRRLGHGRRRQPLPGRPERPVVRQRRLRPRAARAGGRGAADQARLPPADARPRARDRARREARRAAGRQPRLLLRELGLGGQRARLQARPPVPPAARRAAPLQDHRPLPRLPRLDARRDVGHRPGHAPLRLRARRARFPPRPAAGPVPRRDRRTTTSTTTAAAAPPTSSARSSSSCPRPSPR